jgi:hypothetical protein
MNPTKAAAILALVVTLVAVGFMCATLYQEKVELKFTLEAMHCASCVTGKQAAVANWHAVQSQIELLKAQGKDRQALTFEEAHAGDQPVNTDLPCPTCNLPGPDYMTPGVIAIVGFTVSLALFGAAKPKT